MAKELKEPASMGPGHGDREEAKADRGFALLRASFNGARSRRPGGGAETTVSRSDALALQWGPVTETGRREAGIRVAVGVS